MAAHHPKVAASKSFPRHPLDAQGHMAWAFDVVGYASLATARFI
jgi:hypothetical protein